MRLWTIPVWAMILSVGIQPAEADLVEIDFDDRTPGEVVTNQYASLGVTIATLNSPPELGGGASVVDGDPVAYPGSSGKALFPCLDGLCYDIELNFSDPIDYFSILSLDSDEPLTVRGFFEGQEVQSEFFPSGSDLQVHMVELGGIGGATRLDRVVIDLVLGTVNTTAAGPELYSNLRYNVVPEPTTMVIWTGAAFGFLMNRRR